LAVGFADGGIDLFIILYIIPIAEQI